MYPTFAYVLTIFFTRGLAQTITFSSDIVAPAPSTPPTGCRCVPGGTCVVTANSGFDIRIVNPGGTTTSYVCPTAGDVLCCGDPTSITDGCGIRKITNSPAQQGGIAKYGSYPWQAALLTQAAEYIGSGVLLNSNWVLTAAHKVSPYPNRNFKVRLGEWNAQQNVETYPYQEYTPAQVVIHPKFMMSNLQNDVALIKLDRVVPIATSPNINCAPMATAVPAAGTKCWVAGWGQNAFGASGKYQSLLKEVEVPIVDQTTCEAQMRTTRLNTFFVLDRAAFMCAGGEAGKDACTGDGGAALVCPSATGVWQIVGIVAWGIGCATSTIPGVYVNVPTYRDWIKTQMGVAR